MRIERGWWGFQRRRRRGGSQGEEVGVFRACRKCTMRCLERHGGNCGPHSSHPHTSPSFFKIMIGNFRESLFIPPKFAHNLRGSVDQCMYLRDSRGHDWRVKLSVVDGCLAFQEGWNDFVKDHTIGVGEFLVFKYISLSVLSTQIFGTSACERLYFNEKHKRSGCKRKRNNDEFYHISSCLVKNKRKSKERAVHCSCVRHPLKNGRTVKAEPCDSSSIEILESKYLSKHTVEVPDTPEEASHHKVPVDISCVDPEHENKTKLETSTGSSYTGRVAMNENSPEMDCPRGPNIDEKSPKGKKRSYRTQKVHPAGRESLDTKQEPEKLVSNNLLTSQSSNGICSEEGCGDIKMLKALDRKFLLTEEGVCYIVDETLANELGASRVTPIDFCEGEKDDSTCQVEEVAMPRTTYSQCKDIPEIPCTEAVSDTEDEENHVVGEVLQTQKISGSLGNAPDHVSIKVEGPQIESSAQSMINMPKSRKHPDMMGKKSCQSETVPDTVPKEDEKITSPCLNEKDFRVKSERLDSTDRLPSNDVNFSFSVSVKAQAWLELPQRLSFCPGKKKEERKIVMLRDFSMRIWPVMYLQNFGFAGFVGGWKDFAAANNIQHGDKCMFEEVNGLKLPEPMLQVRILKV